MTVSQAIEQLRQDGFSVHEANAVTSNTVKAGNVVRTSPAGGARLHKGSAVTLVPSSGPRLVKVPDVSGQQLSDAKQALRQDGLTVGSVHKVASTSVDAGIVIGTTPAAGLSWPQTRPVTISVSEGPPLPNFVGQNVSAIQAWAGQNGIQLNVQQDTNSDQPQGTITRQTPAPNTPITQNETVTVFVSTGPPQVNVPDVTGQNVNDARKQLEQAGFKVNVNKIGPFNKVLTENPTGQAPKGTTITLFTGF
jgi:serine/threonine-protein kinase